MTMEVQLLDTEGKFLCILNNEDALLGAYPVDDNMKLHVGFFVLHIKVVYLEDQIQKKYHEIPTIRSGLTVHIQKL